MSNSALETIKIERRLALAKERASQVVTTTEAPAFRKSATLLQAGRISQQVSDKSLSQADPQPLPSSLYDGILPAEGGKDVRDYQDEVTPQLQRSSDCTPQGITKNEIGALQDLSRRDRCVMRFLTSDDCNTSQSIFSSSSHSVSQVNSAQADARINRRELLREEENLDSSDPTDEVTRNDQHSQFHHLVVSRNHYVSKVASDSGHVLAKPKHTSLARIRDPREEPTSGRSDSDSGVAENFHEPADRRKTRNQKENLKNQPVDEPATGSPSKLEQISSKKRLENSETFLKRQVWREMPPMDLASDRRYYSLKPDMAFGWRPGDIQGAPIPLHFDYEQNELPKRHDTGSDFPVYFLGNRFNDSLDMHHRFANKTKMLGPDEIPSYSFKFPPNQSVIDAIGQGNILKAKLLSQALPVTKMFTGMSPLLTEASVDQAIPLLKNMGKNFSREFLQRQMTQLKQMAGPQEQHLLFDSSFESGNLDMVVQVAPSEYDLYMRVDSNTRGHHQWFYFRVHNQQRVGTVKLNFVNFTKRQSLYNQGMRINVKSMLDIADQKTKLPKGSPVTALQNEGWVKCGDKITYKPSKLSQQGAGGNGSTSELAECRPTRGRRKYYMMSCEYTFKRANDEVYFAYALPYTVSKMANLVREIIDSHQELVRHLEQSVPSEDAECEQRNATQRHIPVSYSEHAFIREGRFCYSLSGFEVPELTITSHVNRLAGRPRAAPLEIDPADFDDEQSLPLHKDKKYMIVGARVHPGESNASFIMEGFLKFITGSSYEAAELRKRIVFKVVPITNPDGVIAGNYRTSLSGNDLNRQFVAPNPKLHPTVDAMKKLCKEVVAQARQPEPFLGFIDIHGHSRKKSVFMYGPHYPLHNERYFKCKVLPKLIDAKTDMFRFYSCKFRIEKSKLKTARVVLFKEFGIMNCFTLEASFHGFIDSDRCTTELTTETLKEMGHILGTSLFDYVLLTEEDDRQKAQIREALKKKKKKLKARDIAKAIIKQEKQLTQKNESASEYVDNENDLEAVSTGVTRPRGTTHAIRSLSIQNGSTKLSSFSDTHSDGDKSASGKHPKTKNTRNTDQTRAKDGTGTGAILTRDIMELISEEEPSVCRSEGSPPRKQRKRKPEKDKSRAGLVDSNAAVPCIGENKKPQDEPSNPTKKGILPLGGTVKENSALLSAQLRSSSNNRAKSQGKVTMKKIMDELKKQQQAEALADEQEDQDDESSCGRSFSADELSEEDMRQVQGDILGALKRFDDMFNKTSAKDRHLYAKERAEHSKNKKPQQKEVPGKEQQEQRRRKKARRDELMMAAKNAQPIVTMPFQMKGSGNGGNSCTLVMERIMQQRQQAQQSNQVFTGPTGPGKKSIDAGYGFMQRHKKSLNSIEKEAYSRAITEINFNVPRPTASTNLEQIAQKPKQSAGGPKKRESSQNNANVNVGLKGLAAIADLRYSKLVADPPSSKPKTEKPKCAQKGQELQDGDQNGKHSNGCRQIVNRPNRLLKPSNTSVTTAKSPKNSQGNCSTGKMPKQTKSIRPAEGMKKQTGEPFAPISIFHNKQTPKAESTGEIINHMGSMTHSKSHSKTIQESQLSPSEVAHLSSANENKQEDGQVAMPNSADLNQPKIISMTNNQVYDLGQMTGDSEYESASVSKVRGHNFRLKSNTIKRAYLSSQRCSSGNIGQRNKVTSLAKENNLLEKINTGLMPQINHPANTLSLKHQQAVQNWDQTNLNQREKKAQSSSQASSRPLPTTEASLQARNTDPQQIGVKGFSTGKDCESGGLFISEKPGGSCQPSLCVFGPASIFQSNLNSVRQSLLPSHTVSHSNDTTLVAQKRESSEGRPYAIRSSQNCLGSIFGDIGNLTVKNASISMATLSHQKGLVKKRTAPLVDMLGMQTLPQQHTGTGLIRVSSLGKQQLGQGTSAYSFSAQQALSQPGLIASSFAVSTQGGSGHDQANGVSFAKLAGIQKFTTTSHVNNSSAQNYGAAVTNASENQQQLAKKKRRNLKAPSVHSISCQGLNPLNTPASSGSVGVARLNLSSQNMSELMSQAVRKETGLDPRHI